MNQELLAALSGIDVDYTDIRFDEEEKTKIAFEGDDIAQVATYRPRGGHVRAYVGGGKATATFSRIEDARATAEKAARAARILAEHRSKPIRLAEAPILRRSFIASAEHDPRRVSLSEKHELLSHYNRIALAARDVLTTQFIYEDSFSHRSFVNSEGTAVEYDHLIAHILGVIVGRRGDTMQRGFFAVGGSSDFGRMLDRDERLKESLADLDELLDSQPARAGTYPIVLDPIGAAVFIHEAFGHRSEADSMLDNEVLRDRLALGTEIASPLLNVFDDPTIPNCGGTYPVDDEGIEARKTPLIVDGHIAGRLHSRETAAVFDKPVTGNCRASDAGYTPVIRMSNTVIAQGSSSLDDMIASIDDGYYVAGGAGGQGGIDFTFGARWARRIRKGRLEEMVSDANLSGNLFTTLKGISMVGDDLQMLEYFDCGKGSSDGIQMFSRICAGAPHIKLDTATIGGIEC